MRSPFSTGARRPGAARRAGAAVAGVALALACLGGAVAAGARGRQEPPASAGMHAAFDQLLDLNVRDGLVYYRALQGQRRALDRYIASLDVPSGTYDRWPRDAQAAFWLNAYNAIVLRTVIDHYPIRGRSKEFPPNSIRQVPGAFDRTAWRVAGRPLTLDQIEKTHVAAFKDPRMFFALGRGALGGGRLRSEAFTATRLESQLTDASGDCVRRVTCAQIDRTAATVLASPVFSWREPEFVAAYAGAARGEYPGRSPIELAILAFIQPHLFPSEREWLSQNQFAIRYMDFDWRLNDLTGGPPR
jgi:hypothetical protein